MKESESLPIILPILLKKAEFDREIYNRKNKLVNQETVRDHSFGWSADPKRRSRPK